MFPTWSICSDKKYFCQSFLVPVWIFVKNVREETYTISLKNLNYIFFTGIYNVAMLLSNRILKGIINYIKEPKFSWE